jgi:hypothetical protein
MALRNVGILPHHYTVSQPEDGGSMALRNVGILPHHYTESRPEDGSSMVLRNVLIYSIILRTFIFILIMSDIMPTVQWSYQTYIL